MINAQKIRVEINVYDYKAFWQREVFMESSWIIHDRLHYTRACEKHNWLTDAILRLYFIYALIVTRYFEKEKYTSLTFILYRIPVWAVYPDSSPFYQCFFDLIIYATSSRTRSKCIFLLDTQVVLANKAEALLI